MIIFLIWAVCCVAAVYKERLLLWAFLCAAPLAVVSIEWLNRPEQPQPDFGYYPWGPIALFLGIAIVISATGTLSIVRAELRSGRPDGGG
jgi:hypothetical protein